MISMGETEPDRGGAVNDGRSGGGVKMRLGSALQVVCYFWEWNKRQSFSGLIRSR